MEKIIKLTERDLTKIVNRIINEGSSDRADDLYSKINKLIDGEFDDLESDEIADVLENILDGHKSKSYRKKHNIGSISKSDVLKNFKRSKGGSF